MQASSRPLSILFLDFDGVLNSHPYTRSRLSVGHELTETASIARRFADDALKLDPRAIQRVNRIVRATGARVVICSSWRHFHPLPRLRRFLRARGFIGSVVGVTPAICGAMRGAECAAWLATYPRAAWSFAALDDDADYEPMMHRLVKTSSKNLRRNGLEDRHVTAAIKLLRSPAAWQVARWRQKAKKLMARAVTITPPPRYLLPDEARAFVDAMYAAHGYSNVVLVRG